jgi:uncharacterized Zn-finger protein
MFSCEYTVEETIKMENYLCQDCHHHHEQLPFKTEIDLKPFVCPYCGKRLARKGAWKVHVESVHEKKRPHACQHCQRKFYHKAGLKKHTEYFHSNKDGIESGNVGEEKPTLESPMAVQYDNNPTRNTDVARELLHFLLRFSQ